MTLQNLKYAIEISNCHSFSEASKHLFVSQSTLSAAIRDIEEDLGIQIFHRTNRGVTLTYDGEDFIKYAKEIVERSQYLEQRYHARKTIPMRFSVSSQRLPFAALAFTRIFQDINSQSYDVAIRECDTNSVIHDVSAGRSDLGILAIHDTHMKSLQMLFSSCDVCFHEIAPMKNYAFFRAGHPLSDKHSVTLKDLEEYPFVTYDQGLENSHFSEEPLFYKILSRNVHVCDRSTKIAVVRKTDSFSIGPGLTNSNADNFHKGQGEILAKPLEDPLGDLHLGYLSKNGHTPSQIEESYLNFLREDILSLQSSKES